MAPSTPDNKPKRREYNTIERSRFFDAFNNAPPGTTAGEICHMPQINMPPSTGRTLLKMREKIGSPARRRTRKRSSRLGRKSEVTAAVLSYITDQNHPIHEKPYQEQVQELGLSVRPSTLQHHANKDGAQRFKKAYITEISNANVYKRVAYGHEHVDKTLIHWWQCIWFTDEAHFQSAKLQNRAEYELAYPGQRNRLTSLKATLTSGLNITVYCTAGISYYHKGALIFYKDPKEPAQKVYKPTRPRKSKV
ncbi:hypothetical protein EJ08DRAFT_683420 [Tothia fuscella]|uniref:Transposase n=1 Tax=Tothia fuscella TaxID=1048955 RepID=A0A9P4NFZ1_9PEZI|nr:hypothetical protein EJ08DRAFT_683420 [Tothia fuscella]